MMALTRVWDKPMCWGYVGLEEAKISVIQGYITPVYFV